jgi:putative selenate reductase
MVTSAIPAFRIEDKSILEDVKRIENLGVKIHYGVKIDAVLFDEINAENNYIYIAAGAQKAKDVRLEGVDNKGVYNPLEFLYETKENSTLYIGKNVIIIGGGNTAMDAARTAKRLVGKDGVVKVVYRRTIKQMPADFDEILAVQEESIEVIELVSPLRINADNGKVVSLSCIKMELGKKDASGRAKPIAIPNSEFEINADSIIPAFGQDVVIDFVDQDLLKTKPNSYETQLPNVFIGGDALRGGATVIHAVGDGRKIAEAIIERATNQQPKEKNTTKKNITSRALKIKKTKKVLSTADYHAADANNTNFNVISVSLTKEQAIEEASRCLYCDDICDVCTTVCPNLALYPFDVETVRYQLEKFVLENNTVKVVDDKPFEVTQKHQILHLSNWCNQCGNCDTFCPSAGAPYKVKPHLHFDYNTFLLADKPSYYYKSEEKNKIYFKANGKQESLTKNNDFYSYKTDDFEVKLDKKSFKIINYNFKGKIKEVNLEIAVEMSIILQGAEQLINR